MISGVEFHRGYITVEHSSIIVLFCLTLELYMSHKLRHSTFLSLSTAPKKPHKQLKERGGEGNDTNQYRAWPTTRTELEPLCVSVTIA